MARLKTGNWVIATRNGKRHVGIVANVSDEHVTVHFTDEKGETVDVAIVPRSQVERAREKDVPEPRRKDFSESERQLETKREVPGEPVAPTSRMN